MQNYNHSLIQIYFSKILFFITISKAISQTSEAFQTILSNCLKSFSKPINLSEKTSFLI